MEAGIICKVWNISGDTKSKTTNSNLNDSVGYILNPEKEDASLPMETLNQLNRECKYIENDLKTFNGALVGSHNLTTTNIKEAVSQMMDTKKFYGKIKGRAALHMCISLPENESNIANSTKLMDLCKDVLNEIFPNNQAVFAIHTNTDNLHVHIIVNSVGLNGKKIHQNKKFISDVLHPTVNKYAGIYGFTENENWKKTSSTEKFVENKIELRNLIDQAIEKTETFEDFITFLKNENVQINVGKHISLKLPGMTKAIRSYRLGNNYTLDSIMERISTRKDDFVNISVGKYSIGRPDDIVAPSWRKLKRYKELSPKEKNYVLKLIKLGRNPWRENSLKNWQQNRLANQINTKNRMDKYIDFYSKDKTINGALEGIIEAKKKVSHEKKMVIYAKNKYKPILDIYNQMQPIMRKAFLYEYDNVTEYRAEYEKFRELTKRLKERYNKDVFEVAYFLNECDETLLYAQAELKELSEEYRELKKYGQRNQMLNEEKNSLLDMVGLYEEQNELGISTLKVDSFYLSSINSDVVIRIDKTPYKDDKGEYKLKYKITAMDRNGVVIEEFDNSNGFYDFENKLEKLQNKLFLDHCRKFSNMHSAREHVKKHKVLSRNVSVSESERFQKDRTRPSTYSFAQAVNHVKNKNGTNVVMDGLDPNYIAVSTVSDDQLKIVILDTENKPIDSIDIPLVEEKNSDGYKKLCEIQNRYGFSDTIVEYTSVEEARNSKAQNKKIAK